MFILVYLWTCGCISYSFSFGPGSFCSRSYLGLLGVFERSTVQKCTQTLGICLGPWSVQGSFLIALSFVKCSWGRRVYEVSYFKVMYVAVRTCALVSVWSYCVLGVIWCECFDFLYELAPARYVCCRVWYLSGSFLSMCALDGICLHWICLQVRPISCVFSVL